jgi:glutamine synthetase
MPNSNKHTFCDIMFFDYSGVKRSKTVLEPIEERVSFDASSINIGVDIADSDMYLIPDRNSTLLLDDRRIYVGEID